MGRLDDFEMGRYSETKEKGKNKDARDTTWDVELYSQTGIPVSPGNMRHLASILRISDESLELELKKDSQVYDSDSDDDKNVAFTSVNPYFAHSRRRNTPNETLRKPGKEVPLSDFIVEKQSPKAKR